ncbi:hypothetical protein KY346_00260 [Candidatus Woesearchaeota archaeon]|nr:hypothetical protein [Candidatus Woesearchaeota archaeon]
MESKVQTLMQRLDDELDYHPKGYVYRNYAIYADYITAEGERYFPVINLIINNPRGRVGKDKPRFPPKEQDNQFKIILEMEYPPYLGNDNIEKILAENNFNVPELDKKTNHIYYGVGVLCGGPIRGKLTLDNYDAVLKNLVEIHDILGWGRISKSLDWLYSIFKEVYAGAPPPRTKPPKGRKRRKKNWF